MAATTAPTSKVKTAANAIAVTAALVAGIVAVNLIGTRLFGRLDLTEDRVYTLSPSSREVVVNLPDRLTLKAYISSGLQPPLNQYGRYIRDLLDEYAAASKGKIAWEAIDPLEGSIEEKNAKKEELGKYKIQKITLQRVSEAKLEIGSDNYLGIGFQYGGEIESLPQIVSTDGLEYQITSTIKRMVTAKKRKIAFATSEGELSPQQGLQLLSHVVTDYDTSSVQLDKPVPDDVDVLVIAGPKQPFSERAKYEVDQFLMKGKSVAMFLDGMVVEAPRDSLNLPGMEQPRVGRPNDVNLGEMLEKYGVKVRDDLVFDQQNTLGPVPVGGQMFLANYPAFVGITSEKEGFPGKWVVTQHLKALVMPFPSSVELTGALKDGQAGGVTATAVARSTAGTSWRVTGFFLFNPQVEPQKTGETGPFALGYALEGKLKSAYPAGPPGSDPAATTPESSNSLKEAPASARLLVMGDSDMINDQTLPVMQQVPVYRWNLNFFVNSVDWLAHDESLIALRAKQLTARPLAAVYNAKLKFWVGFNVLGIPILLVCFGLVLARVRLARRRNYTL